MKISPIHQVATAAFIAAIIIAFLSGSETYGLNIMVCATALVAIPLLYSIARQLARLHNGRHHAKDSTLKLLTSLMGLFLVAGVITFIYAFRELAELPGDKTQQFTNTEYYFRSIAYALNLFLLNIDGNVLDNLSHHPALKAWISVLTILSFGSMALMLVGLLYTRLYAYYKLNYLTKITPSRNHLYLFFGINTQANTLINDIKKQDPKAVIVIIEEANIHVNDNDLWHTIVGMLAHRRSTFETAHSQDASVEIAEKPLRDIAPEASQSPQFDAFSYLGLTRTLKLIKSLNAGSELHIFFLNDNEEQNIRDIMTLAKDRNILALANSTEIKQTIYCHARKNGPNRMIEDVAVKANLTISIVDSSHLAIEKLKLEPQFHPFHVVDFDPQNPTTVSSSFNCLIIGFGEVGRDAFKFLYEFAAFVDHSSTDTASRRSPFNCHIVDSKLKNIVGTFKLAMPGIFKDKPQNVNIQFHNANYNDEPLCTTLLTNSYASKLNYVIISINDNDEAIALAIRIFNLCRRAGGNTRKLRIMVRCTDDSKVEAMQKIADHYNMGYADAQNNTPVIHIFGYPSQTYSYSLIISDKLVAEGKKFYDGYRHLNGGTATWEERHDKATKTKVPNIDKLRGLRRKESQDKANALHRITKIEILKKALPDNINWDNFYFRYFNKVGKAYKTGKYSNITYPELSDNENLIILRMAMLEHIRWNAAHELMGYTRSTDNSHQCSETTMSHNCLINWEELDNESRKTPYDFKAFDFEVIDTTIDMHRKAKKDL